MSIMGQLHSDLETIRRIMEDDMGEPEPMLDWISRLSLDLSLEERAALTIRLIDEFCALAASEETVSQIEGQRIAIGQMLTRVQLIAAFLMARQPHLKVVSRG